MNLRRTAFVGLLLAGCIVRQPKPATPEGGAATSDPEEAPTPELPSDLPPSKALVGATGVLPGCTKAKAYRFDGSTPDVVEVPPAPVAGGELRATLPALSATLFVCEKG